MAKSPLYEVISRDLIAQITSGAIAPGDRIESEVDLSARYGVSRMTARQAISNLERAGLVVRRRGAGTFVQEQQRVRRATTRLGSLRQDLGLGAGELATRMIDQTVEAASAELIGRLGLPEGGRVVHLRRVRSIGAKPIAIQDSWVPYLLAPELARAELVEGSLYETLEKTFGIVVVRAVQDVTASAADEGEARLLKVAVASPLITITRETSADDGSVVEFARSVTVPDLPLTMTVER